MPGPMLIVGVALLLMALLGPGLGSMSMRTASGTRRFQRPASVLTLRIAGGILGLGLLAYAAAHLLPSH